MKDMNRILMSTLLSLSMGVASAQTQNVEVVELHPAPGQFVNTMPQAEEGTTHEEVCKEATEALNDGQIVHLGTYGGYVTVKFDHPVQNKRGSDLRIKGNGFYSSGDPKYGKETIGGSFEPGIVYVGVGDDVNTCKWYELVGSEYYTDEIHDFSITYHKPVAEEGEHSQMFSSFDNYIKWEASWTDKNGERRDSTGYHMKISFHKQSFWPLWEEGETLKGEACFSNWGEKDLENALINYTITNLEGKILLTRVFNPKSIIRGDAVSLGNLSLSLNGISKATKLKIFAYMQGTDLSNEWEVWVYPHSADTVKDNLKIVNGVDDIVVKRIMEGENLVIQLDKSHIRGNMPPVFLPVYWTQFDNMGIAQTMGILCNPEHAIFDLFPTEYHTNWQWYDLLRDAHPLIFDEYGMKKCWSKDFIPTVQVIDGWKTNRKLGVLAEARLGKGKVVITSMNLTDNLDSRISARQFRISLARYMNSSDFAPKCVISPEHIYNLLKSNDKGYKQSVIRKISVSNVEPTSYINDISDGSLKTVWKGNIKDKKMPASVTFELKKKERVGNVIVRLLKSNKELSYNVYLSLDANSWGIPIESGKSSDAEEIDIDLQYFHEANYVKIEFISLSELAIKDIELVTDCDVDY